MPGVHPSPPFIWEEAQWPFDLPFELLGVLLGQAYALPYRMLDLMRKSVFYLSAFLALGRLDGGLTGAMYGAAAQGSYLLGLGIGDITGPVAETNMGGYADLSQSDSGVHMRMRSRAFVIAESANPSNRVVFINADIAFGDTGVRRGIVSALSSEFPGVYTNENIALVGTHSHSGVGGYFESLLPQLTSLGYVKESADAIITGSVLAVRRAHANLQTGTLGLGNTTILNANANRSPSAYLANPTAERARYAYDQDKDMSVLRFNDASGSARGLLSFFAVHGTSIYQNNTLVSTDNKGYAAYMYESSVEPTSAPGSSTFVAAFTQSNVGDTSPNTLGAFCESPGKDYDGQLCTFNSSTCGGFAQDCHGRGPGFRTSDFESARIIGQYQYEGAKTIMGKSLASVSGPVKAVHVFVNMANYTFALANGTSVHTCPPALGYSFAGGTTDGPGAFDFTQGQNTSQPQNPFWELVKGAITPPPNEVQKRCHEPKPILFNTGYAHTPYEWSTSVVDVQLLRVGQLVMLIAPGEFTTMAGRRIREALRAKLISSGVIGNDAYVVIAGPANAYGHYVTTREEYGVQRYEGASTLYGPFTLEAYIEKYTSLVPFLAPSATATPPSDAPPPEQTSKAISLRTGVVFDAAPIGKSFGNVLTDVQTSYKAGETAEVQFVGASPRNNLRLEGTFLTVDRLVGSTWSSYKTDSHPSTRYRWNRTSTILGTSTVNVSWTIESGTPDGSYRFTYYGDYKPAIGSITSFVGRSGTFTISG